MFICVCEWVGEKEIERGCESKCLYLYLSLSLCVCVYKDIHIHTFKRGLVKGLDEGAWGGSSESGGFCVCVCVCVCVCLTERGQ